MRTQCNGLLIALLLATAPAWAASNDPAPATAPPPPSMDDPGQPASAPIAADDPRLAPLPPESAPSTVATKKPEATPKADGDPTYAPRLPTDDAFHPPPKSGDQKLSAGTDSVSVRTESNGDRIEEFRHGGQLTKVRVKPAHGPAFEINDTNGDGRIDHADAKGNNVIPVQWTLFQWH